MRTINRIVIEFVPHSEQRYVTVGDWLYDGDTLILRISRTIDARHQQLVAMHELVEALACNVDSVTQQAVDEFDIHGEGTTLDEPGDSPKSPYHDQHMIASAVERIMASALHVDWRNYVKALDDIA